MRRIIVLKGRGNVGKTSTLRVLFTLLANCPTARLLSYQSIGRKLDFVAVFNVSGVKVGLTSPGDTASQISKQLRILQAEGCSVIVCTSRSRGNPARAPALASAGWDIATVLKVADNPNRHDHSNSMTAHLMMYMVMRGVLP